MNLRNEGKRPWALVKNNVIIILILKKNKPVNFLAYSCKTSVHKLHCVIGRIILSAYDFFCTKFTFRTWKKVTSCLGCCLVTFSCLAANFYSVLLNDELNLSESSFYFVLKLCCSLDSLTSFIAPAKPHRFHIL